MATETDADRAVFVSANDFGVKVVWTSEAGASAPFDAIFDDTFMALTVGEMDFSQDASQPRLEMRSSDVPGDAAQEDALQTGMLIGGNFVASASYKVVEFKPDGTGMTTVRLMET